MKKTGINGYLLDTNVVIDLFKGQKEIADKIHEATNVFIPVPALGELYLGVENSRRKAHHIDQINSLLQLVSSINATEQTAKIYGKIKSVLRTLGRPIPENDIWIAAIGLEYGYAVVTRDKHFDNIPDLKTFQW